MHPYPVIVAPESSAESRARLFSHRSDAQARREFVWGLDVPNEPHAFKQSEKAEAYIELSRIEAMAG
jgi:hypothetical protein